LAILAGGLLFFARKKEKSPVLVLPQETSSNKKLFLGKRVKTVLRGEVSDPCGTLKSALEQMDFNEKPANLDINLFKQCTDPAVIEEQMLVLENCFPKIKEECQARLLFVRSILRTKNATEPYDKETIADLIIMEFSKKEPDFKKLEKLVKNLLRDDPKNPNYQQIWAMAKFIGSGDPRNQRAGLKEDIYAQVDPEVLNSKDMDGLRIFLETGLDPLKVEQMSRNMLSDDPNRQGSRETLGWALWQQGRRDEALTQLAQALAINPKDDWLRKMYENLQKPGAKKEDYMGRLSLGVKFEDILY
jgi:tetratricopeptide (TPR) repeat protein